MKGSVAELLKIWGDDDFPRPNAKHASGYGKNPSAVYSKKCYRPAIRETRRILFVLLVLVTSAVGCGYFRSGTWVDDPKNFARAWGYSKPDEIEMVRSWVWRSAHFTREESYFFQFRWHEELFEQFISANRMQAIEPLATGPESSLSSVFQSRCGLFHRGARPTTRGAVVGRWTAGYFGRVKRKSYISMPVKCRSDSLGPQSLEESLAREGV